MHWTVQEIYPFILIARIVCFVFRETCTFGRGVITLFLSCKINGKVLRIILGSKRVEVTGGWRKLYKNSFLICIRKVITSRRMRWEGYVARMEEVSNTYKNFGRKIWKEAFERTLTKCKYNIKVDLKVIRWEDVGWINLVRERGNAYVTSGFHKSVEFIDWVTVSSTKRLCCI